MLRIRQKKKKENKPHVASHYKKRDDLKTLIYRNKICVAS